MSLTGHAETKAFTPLKAHVTFNSQASYMMMKLTSVDTSIRPARDQMLVENKLIRERNPVRDEMFLVSKIIFRPLRDFSRWGDVSTNIMSLTGHWGLKRI